MKSLTFNNLRLTRLKKNKIPLLLIIIKSFQWLETTLPILDTFMMSSKSPTQVKTKTFD
jgi:hypothetical protein